MFLLFSLIYANFVQNEHKLIAHAKLNDVTSGKLFIPLIKLKNNEPVFNSLLNNEIMLDELPNNNANTQQLKYSLTNCFFKDCKSTSGGGAISISLPNSLISLNNCYFLDCFANVHGGACSIQSEKCEISNSFFEGCICPRSIYGGQAFYTETIMLDIVDTTVTRCAPSVKADGYETTICRGGIQNFARINSSQNIAVQYASGWLTAESTFNCIKFFTFFNNSSPNQILALTHIRPDDEISSVNMVKNTVTEDGLIYISGSFAILKKFVFYDNSGPLICFTLSAGPAYIILDHCITDINKSDLASVFPIMSDNKVSYNVEHPETIVIQQQKSLDIKNLQQTKQLRLPE